MEQAEEADLYSPVNREKFQIRASIKDIILLGFHLKIFYQSKIFLNLLPKQQGTSHSFICAVVCFVCFCILDGKNSFHSPGFNVNVLVLVFTCQVLHPATSPCASGQGVLAKGLCDTLVPKIVIISLTFF